MKFLDSMPDNYEMSEQEYDWFGWSVRTDYTFCCDHATATVDKETHTVFTAVLAATDTAACLAALQKAELADSNGRVHLTRLRATFSHLCSVKALQHRQQGMTCLCTCQLFGKCGTCPHTILVQWLRKEPDVALAGMEAMTSKKGPTTFAEADELLRTKKTGRPPSMPDKAAWQTMKEIICKVKQRAESRKRKLDEKRNAVWNIFLHGLDHYPDSSDADDEELQGLKQTKELMRMAKNLTEGGFSEHISAAIHCSNFTRKEARDADLHSVCFALHTRGVAQPVAALICGLLKKWDRR